MLLKLSWFYPLCHPPPSTSHTLRQSSQHCSCPWVMSISFLATPFPLLYFTSPWLFCNYLFVFLNPLTSSLIPSHPLPSGNYQNILCIHDSFSVLVCSVYFLDSIVDRYVFLPLIVHNFDLLFLKGDFLTFYIILVWWWWTPLAFSCPGSSLSALPSKW